LKDANDNSDKGKADKDDSVPRVAGPFWEDILLVQAWHDQVRRLCQTMLICKSDAASAVIQLCTGGQKDTLVLGVMVTADGTHLLCAW